MLTNFYYKKEIVLGNNAHFLFVGCPKNSERISIVSKELSDDSWISNVSSYLKDTYKKRLELTLEHFEKIVNKNDNETIKYIGEKIVTICSNVAIEEQLSFRKLPLGEVFKSRASGNGGFDYYNEDKCLHFIVFGEGKYVNNTNPYNKALIQIEEFIETGKDAVDIADLTNLVDVQSINNFNEGKKNI